MSSDFVHLHVHTEYSLLDGQSQIDKLMARAVELEMPAVGLSDHGVMFGAIEFYKAARAKKIKPVIGMEAYLAPRRMTDRDPVLDKKPYHLLLWARNMTGYGNLLKIASAAQLEGYYYRPRIDRDYLAAHAEGIIATSGCLAAEIPRIYEDKGEEAARRAIGEYQDIFGAENFFLELQPHAIDSLHSLNKWLMEYRQSGHTPVQLLASNDVHYVRAEDTDSHDTLLCIQTNSLKAATERMALTPLGSYFLKSSQQMRAGFNGAPQALIDEAFANTLRVAEMCHLEMGNLDLAKEDTDKKKYHLPLFPVPQGFDDISYLHWLCEIGLRWRFPGHEHDPILRERLDRELSTIATMRFNTYFLIVWDLCEFARSADIWWNVRGSGAGSLVAYCLGITNIDPIQNNLLFERFLNSGRRSMPDIDLDYPDDRRGDMIAYTVQKYGEDKVAAIITFGTMGAKGAVRDVARAMDIPLAKVSQAVKLIPQEAKQKPIADYIEANPDLKRLYQTDKDLKQVLDTAIALQGTTRHASMHAAGVIITDVPLIEYVPLHRIPGNTDSSGGVLKAVTQFPMEMAEEIGLLKVDFLGLSTLTILRKACDLIARNHGIIYTMDNIPYRHDSPHLSEQQPGMLNDTFAMLGRGETVGVFQVESSGMQSMLRDMRPHKFEHIVAAVSLYRPGPMDFIPQFNRRLHGEEEVTYHHPLMEPILAETYGILVYQEQIMQVAGELFSYALDQADLMRRAVSKKKDKDLLEHRAIFHERAPLKNISKEVTDKIFDDIVFFANYGFNKSHAADYAVITLQTAYLKYHYPHEYMTALLCVQFDDSTKVAMFLEECRRLQIPVLPPDINYSQVDFDIDVLPDGRRGIRYGLGAIKNVGVGVLHYLIEQRNQAGAFETLVEFCERVDLRRVGKRGLECLIKVGALSKYGERDAMLECLERIIQHSADVHHQLEVGQKSLFSSDSAFEAETLTIPPAREPQSLRTQLGWERELLGLYVTGRPVDRSRDALSQLGNLHIVSELKTNTLNLGAEASVRIAGEVVGLRVIATKNSEMMAVLQVEDWHETAGVMEVVLFPRTYERVKAYFEYEVEQPLDIGTIAIFTGKFDNSRNDPQIIGQSASVQFTGTAPDEEALSITPLSQEEPSWLRDAPLMEASDSTDFITVSNSEPAPSVLPIIVDTPAPVTDITWQTPSPEDIVSERLFDEDVAVQQRHITVVFRSVDRDRDHTRINRLLAILSSFPGHDTYSIRVLYERKSQTWAAPTFQTGYNEKLDAELRAISGLHQIIVE